MVCAKNVRMKYSKNNKGGTMEFKGDMEKMMFRLAQTDWANIKKVPIAEADKYIKAERGNDGK